MESSGSNRERSVSQEDDLSKKEIRLQQLYQDLRSQNFYVRLGVSQNTPDDDIRKVFRGIFVFFHPDNKPHALKNIYGSICQLLSEAKTALTNPLERAKYDKTLWTHVGQPPSYTSPPPQTEEPRVHKKINKEDALKEIEGTMYNGAHYFSHVRNMLINDVIITKEEVKKSERIKDFIINFLESTVSKGGNAFKIGMNQWISVEGITREEIINLSKIKIKERAIKNIKGEIFLGPYYFRTNVDNWIEAGIVTREEIINLPEIKDGVVESIKQEISLEPDNFVTIMDGWIEAGIVRREEIINLPEVKKKVKDLIEPRIILGEVRFRNIAQPWIEIGVVTKEEIEAIITDFY